MPAQDPVDLERLLPAAVAAAMRLQDCERLIEWVRAQLCTFIPAKSPCRSDADFARMFSFAFARALWNGLPVGAGGEPHAAAPEPGRNAPCPCGSQKKYKHCCLRQPGIPSFSAVELWPYVLPALSRDERTRLASGARIPVDAIGAYALKAMQSGRPRDAIDVLEPRLSLPEKHHDDDVARLVDVLCDAYDMKETSPRRKIEFLESTTRRAPRSPLRSEAWQRLATIYMDQRQNEDAWRAVRAAQRDDPHAPALPMLEVHLLASEGRVDEARQRADFWIHALEREGAGRDPDDRRLEFLKQIRKDPLATLGGVAMDAEGGAGRPLAEWLENQHGRDVPAYTLEPLTFSDGSGSPDDPFGGGDEGTDDEDADTDAQPWASPPSTAERYELRSPAALTRAEEAWSEAFPLSKPFSIHEQPFEPDDVWAPDVAARWMAVLNAHPELYDSLTVLDDLATAVCRHPLAGAHAFDRMLYEPLLERSEAILSRVLEERPGAVLPWIVTENRPVLRALARRYALGRSRQNDAGAGAVAERMIRVNPDDNHGMRFELVNDYLKRGDDAAALDLATRYSNDVAPETRFGRVLALFRLNRLSDAEAALRKARAELPKVAPYLLPGRIKRPVLSDVGITIGGDDQAWLYRDAMRGVWQESVGALEWLRKMVRLK